jgi:hypothetical protein
LKSGTLPGPGETLDCRFATGREGRLPLARDESAASVSGGHETRINHDLPR